MKTNLLTRVVEGAVRARFVVVLLLVVLLAAGGLATWKLRVDAVPDLTSPQVSVLTEAPGYAAVEVERTLTVPMENALNGVPHLSGLRATSRAGLSVVTALFEEGTDPWFVRQLVLERVRGVEESLPPRVGRPELSPPSGGLGQIYQFVVQSPNHSPMQLRTLLDWEIVPRLRGVPGIVEVNTMGGELKQFQVIADPARLHARGVSLRELEEALRQANVETGGGYVERGAEAMVLRGRARLTNEADVRDVVVRLGDNGTPIVVRDVAEVEVGPALRYGAVTRDGQGEAVFGSALMLSGANSREVVGALKERIAEVQADLPSGVRIEAVYDRSDFIGRTLGTVTKNLLEGALVVGVVLALFLGSIRAALLVVLGIPASMAVAILGMHLFGVQGDLMSLGAIDFGFLVDGAIVLVEALVAAAAGKALLTADERARSYAETMAGVARPVAFAVTIILLVYLPLLALEGVEGKMFRPMAIVMACALVGAIVYALVFLPALTVLFLPPPKSHGPRWIEWLARRYDRLLPRFMGARALLLVGSLSALVTAGVALSKAGADFVPRIDEGALIVTLRRPPSIGLEEAKRLDLEVETILRSFPEVVTAVGMTGRAEVALDAVGNDSTDVLVSLSRTRTGRRRATSTACPPPSRPPSRGRSRPPRSPSPSPSRTRPTS
jgi:cobalt-zinc-cadmium resistance protein CzcA